MSRPSAAPSPPVPLSHRGERVWAWRIIGAAAGIVMLLAAAEIGARLIGWPASVEGPDAAYQPEAGYAPAHPAEGFRVAAVGPRLSGGAFAALEARYQERWAAPYEVIEFSGPLDSPILGYDASRIAAEYAPDVLIVVLSPQSVTALHPALSSEGRYTTIRENALVPVAASEWMPPGAGWLDGSALLRRIGWARDAGRGQMPLAHRVEAGHIDPRMAEVWPIFSQMVLGMQAEAQNAGAAFAIVIAPDVYAVYPEWYFEEYPRADDQRALFDPGKVGRQIGELAGGWNIPYLDLSPYLQATATTLAQPLIERDGPAWTPEGHAAAAEALDAWFERMGWAAAESN